MFRATKDKVIDATFAGNEARYLNHSCDVKKINFILFYIRQIALHLLLKLQIMFKLLYLQKEILNRKKN